MKSKPWFFLFFLLKSFVSEAQDLLWEKTYGTTFSEQRFDYCLDLGNDLLLLTGQNQNERMTTPSGGIRKVFWQLVDAQTGDTLQGKYWNGWQYGFPFPFAADSQRGLVYSTVWFLDHQGHDSVRSIRASSYFNFSNTVWETNYPVSLFSTPARWSRTLQAIDGDGGFIDCREKSVAGYISQSRVAKFDSMGHLEWQRLYGPANHRNFTTWMDVTRDSCYIISGIQVPLVSGSPDSTWCFLQKIDRAGNEVWRKTFLVDDTLPIKKAFLVRIVVEETPDYGYLVTGSFATSQRGYSLNSKFDSTLSLSGRKWYLPKDSAIAYGKGYADGSCMLAGGSSSDQIPFSIRRTGLNGNTLWKKTFTNPCRGANAVVFNTDSTAILAGSQSSICYIAPDYDDFWWAKITGTGVPYNPLAVKEDVIPRAQREEGMELYPNPAQEQIMLKLPFFKGEKVAIFNHLGQKVMEERITTVRPQVSVQHLPPGLYRVRIGKWVKGFVKE